MAVSLNPEERNQKLTQELEWIGQQGINTQNWFYVRPEDGRLGLYDKPTTIWGLICEWFSRIFYPDKYHQLGQKIEDLTQAINDYLNEEDDGKRLDTFLWSYTVTLNALFYAMFKLSDKGRFSKPFDILPDTSINELVLCRQWKTTNFFMVRNDSDHPISLQIGMTGMAPMFEKLAVPPKAKPNDDKAAKKKPVSNVVGASLLGTPGSQWQVTIDGQARDFPCGYASGAYKFDIKNANAIQPFAEPYRSRFFQERHDEISSTQQHRVTFSGEKPYTVEQHDTGEHSIYIQNDSDNRVRVEISVVNPDDMTQYFTIKPFVLMKGLNSKEIQFNDAELRENGIEQGKEHFDALVKKDKLTYAVRFIEYSKLTQPIAP